MIGKSILNRGLLFGMIGLQYGALVYSQPVFGLLGGLLGIKVAPSLILTPELGPTLPQICLFSGKCPNSSSNKAEPTSTLTPEELSLKKKYLETLQRLLTMVGDSNDPRISQAQVVEELKALTGQTASSIPKGPEISQPSSDLLLNKTTETSKPSPAQEGNVADIKPLVDNNSIVF